MIQTSRIIQAVILIMIIVAAASCAASKDYTGKLFGPRSQETKDSQAVVIRFLELDSLETVKDGWVTTDIIKGKDTTSQTLLLDRLAKTMPAGPDSSLLRAREEKTVPQSTEPVAKNENSGEVRNKRTRD